MVVASTDVVLSGTPAPGVPSPVLSTGLEATVPVSPPAVLGRPAGDAPAPVTATVQQPRRSARHAVTGDGGATTDEDTLSRAMKRKAALNDTTVQGTRFPTKSFLQLDTSCLESRLVSVGVSLGRNGEEVSVSANALRLLEYDRLTVSPKAQSRSFSPLLEEEEADTTDDGQLLSHLVGQVTEVNLDESRLESVLDLQASRRRSKGSKKSKKCSR